MLFLCLSLIESYDDQIRLEALYNKYRNSMYQAAYAVLHNQYDAEDAVHNAFISIVDNLSVVANLEQRQQKAYVCRAARNSALDFRAKIERERASPFDDFEPYCSSDEEDVLEQICNEENINIVVKCILSLPETYRDILHLHYVEGLKTRQIARKFGLKDATVRQRIHRGKIMLIEKIKRMGGV